MGDLVVLAVNIVLVLSAFGGTTQFHDPNAMIKVENFYPPEGFQPVQGYEPPNYRPYKRISDAFSVLFRKPSEPSTPADHYPTFNSNSGTNINRNMDVKPHKGHKFIDHQTSFDIHNEHQMIISPPALQPAYNPHIPIIEFPSFIPGRHHYVVSNEDIKKHSPATSEDKKPTTSQNPFYVGNKNNPLLHHHVNNIISQTHQEQQLDEPFSLNVEFAYEPEPAAGNNNNNQFVPAPFPPHMTQNYPNQNNQYAPQPSDYNNEYKQNNEFQSFDPSHLEQSGWAVYTTTTEIPIFQPNWRRTSPHKYFWTTAVPPNVHYQTSTEEYWTRPPAVYTTQSTSPSPVYWRPPSTRPTPPPYRPSTTPPPFYNFWTPPPAAATPPPPMYAPPTLPPGYWTQPPPVYQYTTPSTATSAVTPPLNPNPATGDVDFKQIFISNKQNNSNAAPSNSNYNSNYNVNTPIEMIIDDSCMKCLCFIESWCSDVGCVMDQGSLSCGWYQLKYEYWLDCGQPGGGWKECANNKRCAEGCVRAYMKRYRSFCSVGQTCPDLARIHNGGLYGCGSNTTEYYGWLIGRCLRREAPYQNIDSVKIPD